VPPKKIQKRLVSTYITRKPSGKYTARVVKQKGETRSTKESPGAAANQARKKAQD
jgi:hypothetical protein